MTSLNHFPKTLSGEHVRTPRAELLGRGAGGDETMSGQVVYGEVRGVAPALTDLGAEATRPVEEVVELAEEIFDAVQRAQVSGIPSPGDREGGEALFERLRRQYHDFATSFPIAFRWMVQTGEYSSVAFARYLRHHVKLMYRDRGEFLDAQVEYLAMLYREKNPRATADQAARWRRTVAESLRRDDEDFARANEEAKAEAEECAREAARARRRRLYEFCRALKARGGGDASEASGRGE